jgi:hypothetical protein
MKIVLEQIVRGFDYVMVSNVLRYCVALDDKELANLL